MVQIMSVACADTIEEERSKIATIRKIQKLILELVQYGIRILEQQNK